MVLVVTSRGAVEGDEHVITGSEKRRSIHIIKVK
jgi:hypothetical protein